MNESFKIGIVAGIVVGIIMSLSVYNKYSSINPEDKTGLDITASVVAVNLDTNEECFEICSGIDYPRDIIKIKIEKTEEKKFYKLDYVNLSEGNIVDAELLFSARPAKLTANKSLYHWLVSGGEDINDPVNFMQSPIRTEDGYFIYHVPKDSESETVYNGLKEGDKIIIRKFNNALKVRSYEVIS